MKIQVEVFWVMTPCGFVEGYQCFIGPFGLHLQGEVTSLHLTLKMKAARCSEKIGILPQHHTASSPPTRPRLGNING
jgi:hypothetical protein